MAHILRPLSLGQLLDETFNIYRQNFLLFVGLSAIPNIALLLVQLVLIIFAFGRPDGVAAVLGGLCAWFASLFVISIVTAATTFGVSDIYLERPTSMAACFSRVGAKALRVAYVSFISGLIVGLGLLLCIAPGIYFAGKYGVAIPAVVLENIKGGDSLSRSSQLTEGSVGRVILVYFLTSIFAGCMMVALDAGIVALASALPGIGLMATQVLQLIVSTLSGILFGPITPIALTLVYYDQRVRKEAFDIEHMMQMMTPPESLASGAPAS